MAKLSKSAKLYLVVVFAILYAPIFYLIFYSFNSGGTMSSFDSLWSITALYSTIRGC